MSNKPQATDPDLFFITAEEAGERLDKVLASRFSDHYSRSYFQQLIELGHVLLNGSPVKKRVKPQEGDALEILFVALAPTDAIAEEIPLDILYEDDEIIVVNKPAGMVVHPAPGNYTGTFVNALLFHCKEIETGASELRPGIVHRLDKETSGVMVAGKTLYAQARLMEQFAGRTVQKTYMAVCQGKPKEGLFSAPIGRHPKERIKMAVVPEGKEAVTMIKVLGSKGDLTLVEARPHTGRTHQIRVHLKALGAPILGDQLYGKPTDKAGRQLLHAHTLSFSHPKTGKLLTFQALMPEDIRKYYESLYSKS